MSIYKLSRSIITMKYVKWIVALLLLQGATWLNAQTLHGIILADTEDPKIGRFCEKDVQLMHLFMGGVAQTIGYDYSDYILAGGDCTSGNAMEAIRSLQVGPQDIVFFYYTGHGARSMQDTSPFPQMKLKDTMYPLYRIADQIEGRSPRLSIAITDACNSFIAGLPSKGISGGNTYLSKGSSDFYKSLFGQTKGKMRITSSKIGQDSKATEDGGLFTIAFLSTLIEKEQDGSAISWENILSATKSKIEDVHVPYWELKIDRANSGLSSEEAQPSVSASGSVNLQSSSLDKVLARVSSDDEDEGYRVRLSSEVLKKYFASPRSIVEVIGRNGSTLLARESASQFMGRISTSFKLQSFVVLDVQKNAQGRIERLRVHEIYRK